jgi:chromosomal replication initiation ATPase DnaA
MNTKDKIIKFSLEVACDVYKVKPQQILNNNLRKGKVIKAKRMFMYYLYVYLDVKHNEMKNYFKKINHATSIHHVKKFAFELETYKEIHNDFNYFLTEMKKFNIYGVDFYEKRKELKKLLKEINIIKDEYIK